MQPNILICGTPGTGKSTIAEMVVSDTEYEIVNVGAFAKENGHVRYTGALCPRPYTDPFYKDSRPELLQK